MSRRGTDTKSGRVIADRSSTRRGRTELRDLGPSPEGGSREAIVDAGLCGPFPPLLVHLVRAAKTGCTPGIAEALTALGALALVTVPIDGVLPSRAFGVRDDVYLSIRAVAERYLGFEAPRRRLAMALEGVRPFSTREAIESAHTEVLSITDTAHMLYGLSLGIVLAGMSSGPVLSTPALGGTNGDDDERTPRV